MANNVNLRGLIREGLTPADALGLPVFLILLFWNLLANWFDSAQVSNGQPAARLLIIFVAQVAMWALLWMLVWVFKLFNRKFQGWSLFAALVVVTAIRGVVIQLVLDAAGINTVTGMPVRVTFSVLYVGLGVVVIGLWLHQIRRHNELLETMFGEQERLYRIKFEAEQKITEANERLIANIKTDLLKRVDALQAREPLQALAGLRAAIDQVVRPMSQQLAYSTQTWSPEPAMPRLVGVSWPRVFGQAFTVENIRPTAATLAAAVLIAPSTVQILTLTHAWHLLIIVPILQLGFLSIYRAVTVRFLGKSKVGIQALAVTLGFLASGSIAGVIADLLVPADVAMHIFRFPSMIYTLIIGVSTALFYQARKAMSKVEEQLMATTAEASWQITRIRQKHRELEHSLANQLHGKVQGALSATYLKLANALKQDDVSAGSLTEYRENLVENILSLGEAGSRPFKFDEAVDETARTWENVCEVQVHVEDQLRELIYTDSLLCHALEDLLPELAFNAVKHGRAKHLDIHIELTTERTIRLTAQDDGSEISPSERMGIGSKLLDECCIGWTRSSNERGTTVVAELPLNRTDLQP
ncbi:MAG: hypothetical protein RL102_317 [Actinomycetota bacterium]